MMLGYLEFHMQTTEYWIQLDLYLPQIIQNNSKFIKGLNISTKPIKFRDTNVDLIFMTKPFSTASWIQCQI